MKFSPFFIGQGKMMLVIGSLLILFGIIIVLHPEILVLIISSFFITIGIILFSLGLHRYQSSKKTPFIRGDRQDWM